MPCALASVVFGIPKVQSRHQASKRTRPEKAGIEPSLENGENPPAISSRMPAVNSRRADNCSILGIPFCAKIVLHPVDVPGTNCNVPQGLSHCSGRHWCIQRYQKQCRPHLVGCIVFRHKDPQTLQPPGGVQGVKFDPLLFSPKNQSQKIHKRPFPVPKRRRAACFHKFCSASLRLALIL